MGLNLDFLDRKLGIPLEVFIGNTNFRFRLFCLSISFAPNIRILLSFSVQIDNSSSDSVYDFSSGDVDKNADMVSPILGQMAEFFADTDKCSPKVEEQLAEMVNKMGGLNMTDEKLKTKMEQYRRPENCKFLQTTRVNEEIWRKIEAGTR